MKMTYFAANRISIPFKREGVSKVAAGTVVVSGQHVFPFPSNGKAHSSNTILGFARLMLRPRALGESRLFI